MRYSKFLILTFIAFLPVILFAQDITGLWKGTLYNDSTKKFYRYEIGISEEKGKLSGFSHTFFLLEDKEFYGVKKIKIKKIDDKYVVEDAGLIANNYPVAPAKGVKQLNVLTLEIKDSIMTLSGPFTTNRTKEYSPLTGTIMLQRKNDFWQSALVPHLQELGLENDLSFVKKENQLIKEEADKIAAQKIIEEQKEKLQVAEALAKKEALVKENLKLIADSKKSVTTNSNVNKEIKPSAPETTIPSKEIVAADPVKTITKKVSNENEIKRESTSKEIIATAPVKKETGTKAKQPVIDPVPTSQETVTTDPAKKTAEIKPVTASKEIATVSPVKTESNKEVKNNGAVTEPVLKTISKEIKPVVVKSDAPAAEVNSRINIVQQTVYFTSDSLQISLYDNGEVDGDTVSVLMNGKIIMAKERLSTNAVKKTIYPPANADSIELLMYAENLGTIAPNTGLLVVHDGKSIYEIRFSGDLNKNASIILRRRKNQ